MQSLEDELDQFPLSSVIQSHAELVGQKLDAWSDRLREMGHPGRKFWDHPTELMYDEAGVLLGAMFVLIQAAITETVSIVMRVYELNGQKVKRGFLMSLEADLDPKSGLSFVEIANGAANFYKHRHEWPSDWHDGASKQQVGTINLIRAIGMGPDYDLADNLLSAVNAILSRNACSVKDLANLVVELWRARLLSHLRQQFPQS